MQTQETNAHPASVEQSVKSSIREQLYQEIEQTPDEVLAIALEFFLFLKSRYPNSSLTEQKPPSTGKSILETLERIGKWEGDDLEECLELVRATRSQVYIPTEEEANSSEVSAES